MPEALLEQVNWQKDRIKTVAESLIGIYRQSLPVVALERWREFEDGVIASIQGRDVSIREVALRGPNFTLVFRGPSDVLIPIIIEGRDKRVEWRQREPYFVCRLNIGSHELDEKLSGANRRVIGEAKDRFDLSVLTDPLRIIFPKNRFADYRFVRGKIEFPH